MSYQVLARKWRPHTFADLVGQEHVVQALVNGLDQDRVHHAFLLTGHTAHAFLLRGWLFGFLLLGACGYSG
jgi:replication-associated recombination protein RarA